MRLRGSRRGAFGAVSGGAESGWSCPCGPEAAARGSRDASRKGSVQDVCPCAGRARSCPGGGWVRGKGAQNVTWLRARRWREPRDAAPPARVHTHLTVATAAPAKSRRGSRRFSPTAGLRGLAAPQSRQRREPVPRALRPARPAGAEAEPEAQGESPPADPRGPQTAADLLR